MNRTPVAVPVSRPPEASLPATPAAPPWKLSDTGFVLMSLAGLFTIVALWIVIFLRAIS
jgi:hypothetical protein